MTLKQPPHSIEAECMLLGQLMAHDQVAGEVLLAVSADDFYRHDHQLIFAAVKRLNDAGRSHDFVAVKNAMSDGGDCDNETFAYLGSLTADAYTPTSAKHHAETIRDLSMRRRAIALCAEIADAGYTGEDSDELMGRLAAGLDQMQRGVVSKARKFTELLQPVEEAVKAARERRRAGGVIGAPTGLPAIDQRSGGLQAGRLYGIAARPSAGKTALLNQVAFHAASHGHPGLICSLEMGAEELVIRALASRARTNVTRISLGYEHECDLAFNASSQIGDVPLWIDTETYGLQQILAQIAAHKVRHGITWAAVDHIGLVETEKFNSRNDQIGFITRSFKKAAKRLGIAVVVVSQLSRSNEAQQRKPGTHDLRDSGNIEQDLDCAIFLHVPFERRDQAIKPVDVGLLKNRGGMVGWLPEHFQFNGPTQTFEELAEAEDHGQGELEPPDRDPTPHFQDRDAA